MAPKIDPKTVLRALAPYPAVFFPNEYGGTDVVFPNFPRSTAGAVNFRLAKAAAREELTVQLFQVFKEGGQPPRPSDPDRLAADDEEVAGSQVLMVEADRDLLLRMLGLNKKRRRMSPSGQRYDP